MSRFTSRSPRRYDLSCPPTTCVGGFTITMDHRITLSPRGPGLPTISDRARVIAAPSSRFTFHVSPSFCRAGALCYTAPLFIGTSPRSAVEIDGADRRVLLEATWP